MTNKELQILKERIDSLEKVIQNLVGIITELHTLLTSKEMMKKLEREEWTSRTRAVPSSTNPFIYTFPNQKTGVFRSSLVNYQNKKRKRLGLWKQ